MLFPLIQHGSHSSLSNHGVRKIKKKQKVRLLLAGSVDDVPTIDAEDLVVQNTAVFNGTVISGSNCIATTNFVRTQIDNLLGPNVPQTASRVVFDG